MVRSTFFQASSPPRTSSTSFFFNFNFLLICKFHNLESSESSDESHFRNAFNTLYKNRKCIIVKHSRFSWLQNDGARSNCVVRSNSSAPVFVSLTDHVLKSSYQWAKLCKCWKRSSQNSAHCNQKYYSYNNIMPGIFINYQSCTQEGGRFQFRFQAKYWSYLESMPD